MLDFSFLNWLKMPEAGTRVEEMFPIIDVLNNDTCITKEDDLVQVIDVQGRDYTGMDKERADFLYQLRKQVIEMFGSDIVVSSHSLRHKLNKEITSERFDNPLLSEINQAWSEQFTTTFRWKHTLVLRTAKEALLDRLASRSSKKAEHQIFLDLQERLQEATEMVLQRLSEFKPRLLTGDDLKSYWGTLINGKNTFVINDDMPIAEVVAGVDLYWPDGGTHQEYVDTPNRYSAWLGIKAYPSETNARMLDSLYQLPIEFGVYQSFTQLTKDKALSIINERSSVTANFKKNGDIILMELEELAARVEAEELKIGNHSWAIQVFADTLDELNRSVSSIKNAIENRGIRVVREKGLQEPMFWSIFPSLEHFNVRKRPVTSENVARFITFSNAGEGIDTCSFGNAPVALLKTKTKSIYSFTFHPTPEPQALGNTLVIGGSNTGKTTLISFLLGMCNKYPNFKAMCFDRLHGMEIFTKFSDGSFNDFQDAADINPFQLPDSPLNRAFLVSWLQMITGQNDDESMALASNVVSQAYLLDPKERNLEELVLAFGQKSKGNMREALSKWLPDGAYGAFFNGKKDALSFDTNIATFDMTFLLDRPEVLGAMADYLFHRMKMTILDQPCPYAIFVDELNKYIESPTFAPKIKETVSEIRKTNGIFIGAVQSAKTVLQTATGREIQSSIATYLLFPDPTGEEQYYMGEGIGLNQSEFDWIKTPSHREVMVKRRGGESVILQTDLSGLGKYLNVFDSSSSSIKRLNQTIKSNPEHWKSIYLDGEK
jgi:type IV secretion/conjugal transfer VirB4 family ATPase